MRVMRHKHHHSEAMTDPAINHLHLTFLFSFYKTIAKYIHEYPTLISQETMEMGSVHDLSEIHIEAKER